MFIGRDRRSLAFLNLRITLFVLGAGFGLFGMSKGPQWLVWVAIGFLLVAFVLRFAGTDPVADREDEDGRDGDEEDGRLRE